MEVMREEFNCYNFWITKEEKCLLETKLYEFRVEKERQEAIEKHKTAIYDAATLAICEIGLEEVKRIVRELGRELRKPVEI